jgi:hypothetical protein
MLPIHQWQDQLRKSCQQLYTALFVVIPICLVGQSLSVPAIITLASVPEEHHEEPHRHLENRESDRRTPRLPALPKSQGLLVALHCPDAPQDMPPRAAAPLPAVHLIGAGVRMRL